MTTAELIAALVDFYLVNGGMDERINNALIQRNWYSHGPEEQRVE